jgi:hypothetical protein
MEPSPTTGLRATGTPPRPAILTDAARRAMPQEALAELELRTRRPSASSRSSGSPTTARPPPISDRSGMTNVAASPGRRARIRLCNGPTAYLFRCLHCDWHGAFVAFGA